MDDVVCVPLHNIWLAGLDGSDARGHGQRQLSTLRSPLSAREALHRRVFEWCAGQVVYIDWQADGVPAAVAVERISIEGDIVYQTVGGGNGCAVVGIGLQGQYIFSPVGGVGAVACRTSGNGN